MMTNFDFLKKDKQFLSFADPAAVTEHLLHIDTAACILACRRAMEIAVKWMYTVDDSLRVEYSDTLNTLMGDNDFRELVGSDVWRRMDLIRRLGNTAAHESKKISVEQASLCIENLFAFLDFVACCYSEKYSPPKFDRRLLELTPEEAMSFVSKDAIAIDELIAENDKLKKQLSARRRERQPGYAPQTLGSADLQTRKIYTDTVLFDNGWRQGVDRRDNEELRFQAQTAKADYVLYGDDGRALAVVEITETCQSLEKGRAQAKLCADILEKKYHRRPVVFLTDGFTTRMDDGLYPERVCSFVWSKNDLEKLFRLRGNSCDLRYVKVNKKIAGRYYQEAAVKAVCSAFGEKKMRRALIVMAAGAGKTRTVIELCRILRQRGVAEKILYLTDRESLVTQAGRDFVRFAPELTCAELRADKTSYDVDCVFSSYAAMYNAVDTVRDNHGRMFTPGHFDLIVCDEAQCSVVGRYKNLLDYFDARFIGLASTSAEETDGSVYEAFGLPYGEPTYAYTMSKAVSDGYLADFVTVKTDLKFGAVTMPEENAAAGTADDGERNAENASSPLNEWLHKDDTIRQAIRVVMNRGLKTGPDKTLGKTVIFAADHAHAEKIVKIFREEYPQQDGFAAVIDNCTPQAQELTDRFADGDSLPRIAVSSDMLEGGIDVPAIVNLVFFKKAEDRAKFRQMIGRGARICRGDRGENDKDKYYVFDLCGNFESFGVSSVGVLAQTLRHTVLLLKSRIIVRLQAPEFSAPALAQYRQELTEDIRGRVCSLDKENFAVKQHIDFAEKYAVPDAYDGLTPEQADRIADELAPLLPAEREDIAALRFDAFMYGLELAFLSGGDTDGAKRALLTCLAAADGCAAFEPQRELIGSLLRADGIASADIAAMEKIRSSLRGYMKHLPDSALPTVPVGESTPAT